MELQGCQTGFMIMFRWVGRNRMKQYYWGGAETDSRTCGCHPYCEPTKRNSTCNCDAKDEKRWLEDSGLLLDSSRLPVFQLRFGDLGKPNKAGSHTLGPLICYQQGHIDEFKGIHNAPAEITSPEFPSSYPPPFHKFTWKVIITAGDMIELTFPDYDVLHFGAYNSVPGCQDVVTVSAKPEEGNIIVIKRQGNAPPYYISQGSATSINITLTTCNQDERLPSRSGFRAVFKRSDCVGCNAAVGQNGGTTFCDETCGIIASEGYPFPDHWYSNSKKYNHSWILRQNGPSSQSLVVELNFNDFDIPGTLASRNCTPEQGILNIYDGEGINDKFLIGRFCNYNYQGVVYSTQPIMTLVYITKWKRFGNGRGFHATYKFVQPVQNIQKKDNFKILKNIANGKLTKQSSTLEKRYSSLAVDGRLNGTMASGYCTATKFENEPWWQVDLQKPYFIHGVIIHNRLDSPTLKSNSPHILTWPQGLYGLPMTASGCPSSIGFSWESGLRFHAMKYEIFKEHSFPHWSDGMLLKGGLQIGGGVKQHFCMKTKEASVNHSLRWMPGQYCIYQFGDSCPIGFKSGHITWYEKSEGKFKSYSKNTVPKGEYTSNSTTIYFCCRSDHNPDVAIRLPISQPFYLLQFGSSCQKVQGMSEIEQYFHFNDVKVETLENFKFKFKAPYPRVDTTIFENGFTLYYCYYDITYSLRGFNVLVDNTGIISSIGQYFDNRHYGIRHLEERKFQEAYRCASYPVTKNEPLMVHLNCSQPVLGQYITIQMYNRYDSLQICEVEVFGEEACGQPLGMASEEIYDSQINSTSNDNDFLSKNARLNGKSGWCASEEDKLKYITIDLKKPTTVTGIILQGDAEKRGFVKNFHLSFSNNGSHWTYEEEPVAYKKNYTCKTCNPERYSNDMNIRYNLLRGIKTQFVRFEILSYHNFPCLRMEILGCRNEDVCDETFTEPEGTIHSPNYPFYYGQDKSCWWKIMPPPGLHVQVDFIVYDIAKQEMIEHNSSCQDQLFLYPGSSNDTVITSPYGKFFPKQVTSINETRIHLKTCIRYSMSRYRGFLATYKFVDCPGCGSGDFHCPRLHNCSFESSSCGKIVSYGYPLSYQPNHRCRWLIVAEPTHYINVTFSDFDIVGGNNQCVFDHIIFYDGEESKEDNVIGKYCNELQPGKYVVSNWNTLLIEFSSDAEHEGRGFSLTYIAQKYQLPKEIKNEQFEDESCPVGWKYYNKYCYNVFHEDDPLPWYVAEKKCTLKEPGRKGHLVSIVDKREIAVVHYFLVTYWDSRHKTLYIGLNDEAREGIYRWSDGNPMIFTDWSPAGGGLPTQPDGGAYQDCTMLRMDSIHSTALWHDIPCSLRSLSYPYSNEYYLESNSLPKTTLRDSLPSVNSFICKIQSNKLRDSTYKAKHLYQLNTQSVHVNVLEEKYFICRNKEVISNFFVCDGAEDCRDGSDEEECGTSQKESSFQCGNGRSISISAYCDFKDDCSDRSDESRCAHRDCTKDEFQCRNGQCIPSSQRCDLLYHCHDNSDEKLCLGHCNDNFFKCYDGTCIPKYVVCDGHRDCPGRFNEDENDVCYRLARVEDIEGWNETKNLCSNRARRTCHDLFINDNINASGYYTIDPDGNEGPVRPFKVYCDIDNTTNTVKTVIHHDSEQQLYVKSDVQGKGYYRRSVIYEAGMNGIASLINISSKCRQYIEWNCTGTGFHFYEETPVSWWVSRRNEPQYYWGGAHKNKTCRCHPYCLRPDLKCNCDAVGKDQESRDDGYVEDKDKLPVTELRFGNTFKTGQFGYHRLGPLECFEEDSEQLNCTNSVNYITCQSNHFVRRQYMCLYEFDQYGYHMGCRDVTHLRNCETFTCPKDYVKCPKSYCIPSRYVCDGKWDCIAGADEQDCDSYSCPGQYKCYNKSCCVPLHQLCDNIRHCPHGDDELLCNYTCPEKCKCIGLYASCVEINASSLPETLSPELRKLDFSKNVLDMQKADFNRLRTLAELILQYNDITELPANKFSNLGNLYKLDLSNNKIHFIARSAFEGLKNLKSLHLENNPTITEIESEAFYGLARLENFNLTGLRLNTLRRKTFWGMSMLKSLNISNNNILQVENGAFLGLHSVTVLDMRGNDIADFSHHMFVGMKSLVYLYSDSFKFCCVAADQIPFDNCWPRGDEISSCEDLMSSPVQRSFLWVLGLVALVANLFVVIWRIKIRDFNRPSSLLIISLGFADLLMGIYLLIIAVVDVYYRGHYIEISDYWRESTLCKACGVLSTVSSEVSVFTLVFITLDRLITLSFPFSSQRFSISLTYKVIALSWLIAMLIAALPLLIYPYFFGQFYARSGVCLALHITSQKAAGWEYSIAVFFCINFVVFLVIFSGYLYMYLSIRKSYRALTRLNARQVRENKIGRQMALIVSTNSLCWFPIILIGLMAMAGVKVSGEAYSWIAVFILPLNSATNPIIYTISSMKFMSSFCVLPFRSKHGTNYGNKTLSKSLTTNGNRLREPLQGRPFKPPQGYQSLVQFLRTVKPLKPRMLLKIAASVCNTLRELHADSYALGGLSIDAVFVSTQDDSEEIHVYVPDFNAYRICSSPTNDFINDTAMDMEEFGLLLKKMLRIYHVSTRSRDPNQGTAC
ncbi:uncharacterized protein LOC111619306 isoform X2 [Centruroides sculpturatus]|uniref:uncharacterized protein LOC111619306 isoform X2 n=1 Tax=Centruroides sculpturatus TaxID=218467 RepID=UPI000C6EAD0B|nr:uncharacterized protein LOC111619306 isoform X2 [Centruroides sculpturatus]